MSLWEICSWNNRRKILFIIKHFDKWSYVGSSTRHSNSLMGPTSFIEIEGSWPWKWTLLAITLNAVYKILEQLTDYNLYIYETCKLWEKNYALFSNFKLVKCFHVTLVKLNY